MCLAQGPVNPESRLFIIRQPCLDMYGELFIFYFLIACITKTKLELPTKSAINVVYLGVEQMVSSYVAQR